VNEVIIDDAEIVAVIHRVEQLLAHVHQRSGTSGREIEAPKQLQPPRLAADMKRGGGLVRRRLTPSGDRALDGRPVVTEGPGQGFEEGDARSGGQFGIAREYFLRQRHAGSLAAAGQQVLAELDQTRGAFMRRFAPLALDQCAAAIRDALQHFAEKGGVHRVIPRARFS
jgi:hypothetical protein